MENKEFIINSETLVVKKTQNFLEAVGISEKIMEKAHRKFIGTMNKECGVDNKCTAIGYKKFLDSLTILEQKAVLFFAMVELNRATHELSQKIDKDKKIILPPKQVVKHTTDHIKIVE